MGPRCELCKKNVPDLVYAVDPSKPTRDLCGECVGKHPPRILDNLLGVKQKFYGDGKDRLGAMVHQGDKR